jgi:hypothetical protein
MRPNRGRHLAVKPEARGTAEYQEVRRQVRLFSGPFDPLCHRSTNPPGSLPAHRRVLLSLGDCVHIEVARVEGDLPSPPPLIARNANGKAPGSCCTAPGPLALPVGHARRESAGKQSLNLSALFRPHPQDPCAMPWPEFMFAENRR